MPHLIELDCGWPKKLRGGGRGYDAVIGSFAEQAKASSFKDQPKE
jgi:hypothetical protein